MQILPMFRGVTKDKKVVYGELCYDLDHDNGETVLSICKSQDQRSEYFHVDPLSVAMAVNLEESREVYKKIRSEQDETSRVWHREYELEEIAFNESLKTLKFASFWLPGLNDYTRGGDVTSVQWFDGEEDHDENAELVFKNGEIVADGKKRNDFCRNLWSWYFQKTIGNAYLNPELLESKNDYNQQ